MNKIFLFVTLFVVTSVSKAQVAINTNSSTPDPSSMLDVTSVDKGFLLPRMNMSARNLIGSPANGLIIYQTDNTPGLYVNTGTATVPSWKLAGPDIKPAYCHIFSGLGSGQVFNSPSYTVLDFTHQGETNNILSSTVTDNVTIVTAGVYKIYYSINYQPPATSAYLRSALFKYGFQLSNPNISISNTSMPPTTDEGIYSLNAGDVISLRVYVNFGSAQIFGASMTLIQIY